MERVEVEEPSVPFVRLDGQGTKAKKSKKSKSASDKKKKKKKEKMDAEVPMRRCIRARARALCRVMELRTSIARYYLHGGSVPGTSVV